MKNSRAWTVVALCGVLGALTACSNGTSFVKAGYDFHSVGRIAVVVSMNAGGLPQQQEVADLFALEVLKKGYDVIDRANLADLSKEAAFQNASGITSPEGRHALAIHNVSAVIVVNVSFPGTINVPPSSERYWIPGRTYWDPYYGGYVREPGHWEVRTHPGYVMQSSEEITMTAKMLDVQTGDVLWVAEGEGDLKSGLATIGGAVLGGIGGAVLGSAIGNSRGAVLGGLGGALVGGVTGAALEENMAQLMRSVIYKTCRGLPMRTQAAMVSQPAPVASPAVETPAPAPVAVAMPAAPAPVSPPVVAPAPAPAAQELTWPRSANEGAATLTMYQPKIQKWGHNAISCQAAVSIQSGEPVYGVASLTAAAELNEAGRTVTFRDFQVAKLSFPTAAEKEAQYLDGFNKLAPPGATTIPLDKLEASFVLSAQVKAALSLGGAAAGPRIVFTTIPTVLVLVDGQPVLKPMEGLNVERVVNTRSLIVKTGDEFYLTALDFWYQAPAIKGPWTPSANPPAILAQARDAAVATRMVDLMQPEPGVPQPRTAPAVRVSTVPMDLIQTDGPPQLFPIEGGNLLQVKNTDDAIFLDLKSSQYYALLSKQWFASKSLYGPWAPVAARDLPADLAKMPAAALTANHAAPPMDPAAAPPAAPATPPPGPVGVAPYEPPPPPQEAIPVSPGPDYYWTNGYWDWGPAGYVWIGGRWAIGVGPGIIIGPGHPWGGWGHGRRWR